MSAADTRPTCPKCHGTGRVAEVAPVGGLDEMLAAAEERGRRAGIEEAIAFVDGSFSYSLSVYAKQRLVDFLRSLAPRDSGKEDGPLDKMKHALDEKVRMERERYASFCDAVAAGSAEDRALLIAAETDADKDRK